MNKEHGTDILVSEAVYERVRHRFSCRFVDTVVAKGMVAETRIYQLLEEKRHESTGRGRGVRLRAVIALIVMMAWSSAARADGPPIKVGILFSQSGPMAISEAVLADTLRMLIRDQNAKGGLLGRKLEPVIADPASDPGAFKTAAERMLTDDRVAVVFGGWTSASRRAMLPVFEKLNGLLFYPLQFEGGGSSRNIFYTGAVPNQQAIPALRFLISKRGGGIKRWFLLGTDYVYPRTANAIVDAYLRGTGVTDEDIMTRYVPFAVSSWEEIVSEIRAFSATDKRTAVISTINGDSNLGFYRELDARGLTAEKVPVMAFSIGERELAHMEPKLVKGHFAAWSYFSSAGLFCERAGSSEFLARLHREERRDAQ